MQVHELGVARRAGLLRGASLVFTSTRDLSSQVTLPLASRRNDNPSYGLANPCQSPPKRQL